MNDDIGRLVANMDRLLEDVELVNTAYDTDKYGMYAYIKLRKVLKGFIRETQRAQELIKRFQDTHNDADFVSEEIKWELDILRRSLEAFQINQLECGTTTLTNIQIFKSQLNEMEENMGEEELDTPDPYNGENNG